MKCPECHFQNPEGINFCGACGARLEKQEKTAPSERKHITIVFTDLSGYTAMTERLDPEEVRGGLDHRVQFLDAETLKSQIFRAFYLLVTTLMKKRPLVQEAPLQFIFVSRHTKENPLHQLEGRFNEAGNGYYLHMDLHPLFRPVDFFR